MFKKYIKSLLDKVKKSYEVFKEGFSLLAIKARREFERMSNKEFKNGFLTGLMLGLFGMLAFLTFTGNL